jgi:hypothetical protein
LVEQRPPGAQALGEFTRLAKEDDSAFVRLYLASALQRTPVEQRRPILEPLLARAADATDHNLPLMYWFALEPVVGADGVGAIDLLGGTKIPLLRQFIARRLASESLSSSN